MNGRERPLLKIDSLKKSLRRQAGSRRQQAEDVIAYWLAFNVNGVRLRQFRGTNTKTYHDTVQELELVLSGAHSFLPQLSIEDLKQAIYNFHLAALNPDYEPLSDTAKGRLRKLGLKSFLYNPFSKDTSPKYRTPVLFWLENRPRLRSEAVRAGSADRPQEVPAIYPELEALFVERVLGGVGQVSGRWRDKLLVVAQELECFLRQNREAIRWVGYENQRAELARWVFETLDRQLNGDWGRLTPGWFNVQLVNTDLPKYLYAQGILSCQRNPTDLTSFVFGGR